MNNEHKRINSNIKKKKKKIYEIITLYIEIQFCDLHQ